jgi:hypothetical protein
MFKKIYIALAQHFARRAGRKMTAAERDLLCIDLRKTLRRDALNESAKNQARYAKARYMVVHGRRAI